MHKYEYVIGIAKCTGIFAAILYLFYESFAPAAVLFPIWIFYMKDYLEDMARKKEQEFNLQFRDSIEALSAAMKAGYSVENAIREVRRDLESVYAKDTRIMREFARMEQALKVHIPVSRVLEDFAARVQTEDAQDFVRVFTSAKASGGDGIAVIRDAARRIREKADTEQEIQTMLSAKRLEFEIMSVIPFGIILYMKAAFGDFLSVLYGNLPGIAVMSVCLGIYLCAYRMGRRLIRIEV